MIVNKSNDSKEMKRKAIKQKRHKNVLYSSTEFIIKISIFLILIFTSLGHNKLINNYFSAWTILALHGVTNRNRNLVLSSDTWYFLVILCTIQRYFVQSSNTLYYPAVLGTLYRYLVFSSDIWYFLAILGTF